MHSPDIVPCVCPVRNNFYLDYFLTKLEYNNFEHNIYFEGLPKIPNKPNLKNTRFLQSKIFIAVENTLFLL